MYLWTAAILLTCTAASCQSIEQGIIARIPDATMEPMTNDRRMSGRTPDCDDGMTNLTIDWDKRIADYGCFGDRWPISPTKTASEECTSQKPPQAFHKCMTQNITYLDPTPTWGDHRPSWPVYGEYTYIPPQRYLHSLEHGAVVFLYHPCANAAEIHHMRKIVTGCLRRHIISPNNKLSKSTPFALLTWGCKLLLTSADENAAVSFILRHARQGPEDLEIDGQFSDSLEWPAATVSDLKDSVLCPQSAQTSLSLQKLMM